MFKDLDIVRQSQTLKELVKHLTPEARGLLGVRLIVTLIIAASGFAYDWTFGSLVQASVASPNLQNFNYQIVFYFGLVLLVGIVQTITPRLDDYVWRRLVTIMLQRYEFLFATQRTRLDVAIEDNSDLRDKIHHSSESIHRVTEFLHHGVSFIRGVMAFCIAACVVAFFNPAICLIALLATVPELIIGMRRGKVIWSVYQREGENRRRFSDFRSYLHNPNSIRDLKLLGISEIFLKRYLDMFDDFQSKELSAARHFTWLFMVSAVFSFIGIGVALAYFLAQVVQGAMEVSQLVFVFGSVLRLRSSTENLFHQLSSMNSDGLFVFELHRFLRITPVIKPSLSAKRISSSKSPKITFEDVWFRYDSTQNWVLRGISFDFEPGQKLAIVGDNGAGKSTLVKLICRFYDPVQGRILVDGTDLKDISIDDWWGLLGCLFQDFERYSLTLDELIAMGGSNRSHDFEHIKIAGERAGLNKMVSTFKDGWHQLIGRGYSNSVELSAGQHQRVALARLFYRSPPHTASRRAYFLDRYSRGSCNFCRAASIAKRK